MGLDQMAFRTKTKLPAQHSFDYYNERWGHESEINGNEAFSAEEFFRWRKHANLQGWMCVLFEKKGGKLHEWGSFCEPVEVTLADLEELEKDTRSGNMPHTKGFFFGESTPAKDEKTLDFIALARRSIESGYQVFYDSSW